MVKSKSTENNLDEGYVNTKNSHKTYVRITRARIHQSLCKLLSPVTSCFANVQMCKCADVQIRSDFPTLVLNPQPSTISIKIHSKI